jgi:ligand-binding sensor domain-containing protein
MQQHSALSRGDRKAMDVLQQGAAETLWLLHVPGLARYYGAGFQRRTEQRHLSGMR